MLKSRLTCDVHCPKTHRFYGVTFLNFEQNNYKPKSIKNHTRWIINVNWKNIRNMEELIKNVRPL